MGRVSLCYSIATIVLVRRSATMAPTSVNPGGPLLSYAAAPQMVVDLRFQEALLVHDHLVLSAPPQTPKPPGFGGRRPAVVLKTAASGPAGIITRIVIPAGARSMIVLTTVVPMLPSSLLIIPPPGSSFGSRIFRPPAGRNTVVSATVWRERRARTLLGTAAETRVVLRERRLPRGSTTPPALSGIL